ncbi:hypothetical protein GEV33_011603 [Tenebrio molitor]|uniref:Uncharacterized protein n=1 Tax=Tenebrio molitor TaxID=7067 RepID=A0A8J6HCH1_TENMO|nr:hypothetical protein GEV33_011603 [Tenebrio molitor]
MGNLIPQTKGVDGVPRVARTPQNEEAVLQAFEEDDTLSIRSAASSSVAAWLSEIVLRGRRPGASGFESHRRGRIFSKEGTSAGPWMCVYVFQGLTVRWWKEERNSSDTTTRSAGFKSRPDGPPRKEKGEERGGVGGRGKYPGAPPHQLRKPTASVGKCGRWSVENTDILVLKILDVLDEPQIDKFDWCRERINWDAEWNVVVFSDESRFCCGGTTDDKGSEDYVENGAIQLTLLNGMWLVPSPLIFIQGSMTVRRYIQEVLQPVPVSYIQDISNALYHQNNALSHIANISLEHLEHIKCALHYVIYHMILHMNWRLIPKSVAASGIGQLNVQSAAAAKPVVIRSDCAPGFNNFRDFAPSGLNYQFETLSPPNNTPKDKIYEEDRYELLFLRRLL